jgi:hypothetical protein
MAHGRGGFFFFFRGVAAAAWEDLGSRQQPKPDLNLGDTQVREFRPRLPGLHIYYFFSVQYANNNPPCKNFKGGNLKGGFGV